MISLTPPTGLTLSDWASQVCLDLDSVNPIGRLVNEERWQDWGAQILNINTLGSLPSPYGFTEWQDWAERFYGALT